MNARQQRHAVSTAYFARVIVQDGIAKGYSENRIRADVHYVCEFSEVLNVTTDVQNIIDVGYGRKTA